MHFQNILLSTDLQYFAFSWIAKESVRFLHRKQDEFARGQLNVGLGFGSWTPGDRPQLPSSVCENSVLCLIGTHPFRLVRQDPIPGILDSGNPGEDENSRSLESCCALESLLRSICEHIYVEPCCTGIRTKGSHAHEWAETSAGREG